MSNLGPLNNASQLERVSGFIQRLPDHARVLAGGHRSGDRGFFYEASVVDGQLHLRQARHVIPRLSRRVR